MRDTSTPVRQQEASSRTAPQADEIVTRARAFAERSHGAQRSKYFKQPYVVHLDAVAVVLRRYGISAPAVLAAADLHDVVEDTDAMIQDIHDAFGEEIAELVYWVTDEETGRRKTRKTVSAWLLGRAPWAAKMIKLADLIDDTEDIRRNDRPASRARKSAAAPLSSRPATATPITLQPRRLIEARSTAR